MERIQFSAWQCFVMRKKYFNGNLAIELYDNEGPVASATVNFAEGLPQNVAYIKDYGENVGMLDALKKAGIVTRVVSYKLSGYIVVPLCIIDLERLASFERG